jgi:hypothetical protein
MLKKSIIGLAVLALAMPAFAGDDIETKIESCAWPCVFKFMPVCETVKVVMNVGYYVKIIKCKKLKIVLGQDAIDKYSGCTDFEIECNFDLELGASVHPTSVGLSIAPKDKWSAWIEGNNFVDATMGGGTEKRTICVKVKDAKIINADPNKELHVADAWILVRPTASPTPCP